MIRTILNKWKTELGELPQSYFCFDLETTGFKFSWDKSDPGETQCGDDLIVELGFCAVKNGQAEYYQGHILDWTRNPYVEEAFLRHKLDSCREHMARQGRTYRFDYETLREHGKDPVQVLDWYRRRLLKARQEGNLFVGHNICNFDARVFAQGTEEWLGKRFDFQENEILDTAAIEKASQVGMAPLPEESMMRYFKRVMATPWADCKYNLDNHCVQKYRLEEKYELDSEQDHTAGYDAMLTHLLIEEYREIADGKKKD